MDEKNKCYEIRELLSSYIDRQLSPATEQAVRAHLNQCADCRKEYEELINLIDLIGSIEEVVIPQALEEQLHVALKEEGERIRQQLKQAEQSQPEKQQLPAEQWQQGEPRQQGKFGLSLPKPVKKQSVPWRIVGTLAAVFAVCVISYTLFDRVNILPDDLWQSGQDQVAQNQSAEDAEPQPKEQDKVLMATPSEIKMEADEEEVGMSETKPDAGNGTEKSWDNLSVGSMHPVQNRTLEETKDQAHDVKTEQPMPLSNLAAPAAGGAGDKESNGQSADDSDSFTLRSAGGADGTQTTPGAQEHVSRGSMTTDDEDQAAKKEQEKESIYKSLMEEELENYSYEITKSEWKKESGWHFTVFIFSEKNGNMIEKEIEAVGKDGKIQFPNP